MQNKFSFSAIIKSDDGMMRKGNRYNFIYNYDSSNNFITIWSNSISIPKVKLICYSLADFLNKFDEIKHHDIIKDNYLIIQNKIKIIEDELDEIRKIIY